MLFSNSFEHRHIWSVSGVMVFMLCTTDCVFDISGVTPLPICACLFTCCASCILSETILLEVSINCDHILDGHTSVSPMHSVPAF